ncbi:AMP-dependent acyl-CoA synthetase/AMP-acid ligases II [Chryseobacterium sp. StRB126]|nr:hypothetical protein [Chryseobacterium sp. StRB126]BAP32271.1 AMP-dependent acyl-CoA synthetase/AMP-acid ligases II [Chryseobacterium sp. StRB126]
MFPLLINTLAAPKLAAPLVPEVDQVPKLLTLLLFNKKSFHSVLVGTLNPAGQGSLVVFTDDASVPEFQFAQY